MIYVVECPAGAAARAWFAFDDDDLVSKAAAARGIDPWTVHDRASARELLDMFDLAPGMPGARALCPGICAAGEAWGWDTELYRADALHGAGRYAPEPVGAQDAVRALVENDGPGAVFADEAAALAAFEDAAHPLWQGEGWRARHRLREQLIALEVLADDL